MTRIRVGRGQNAATILAIRALELLRASLLEMAPRHPASEPEAATPAPRDELQRELPARETNAPRPRGFAAGPALAAGVLGLYDLHDVGVALGPSLRVSQGIGEHFFGRLVWAGP